MATTPALISVEEYLRTVYRPDRDYVDGEVLARNRGEKPHARLQKFLIRLLEKFEEALNVEVLPEQRVEISSSRYRVPDVLVAFCNDSEPLIVRSAPLLCIEILSSDDRMNRVRERVQDYVGIGVRASWVVDPWRRVAYAADKNGVLHEVSDRLVVPGTPISAGVDEIFAELDRLEARSAKPVID